MTYGPIDFIALEFPGNRFKGEILPELFDLVDKGIIRIIDLVVIMKDQGEVIVRELRELDAAHIAMFDPLKAEVSQMITRERHQCDCRATRREQHRRDHADREPVGEEDHAGHVGRQRPAGDVRAHPA